MNFRSMLVGLGAASLLVAPVAGTASSAVAGGLTGGAPAMARASAVDTSIRFLDFDHTREFGSLTHVRGQVEVPSRNGALAGVHVKLYRQFDGSSAWHYLATRTTSQTSHPQFRFSVRSRGNADYRVAFGGNSLARPSRDSTSVRVYRHITAQLEDRSGRFHGRITPHYAHGTVSLDKRTCANCGWHRVRSDRTGDRGGFSFKVNAPRQGRYFWRVSVPASVQFIRSYSAVFTTRLR